TALNMHALLRDLFPPEQYICADLEVAPARIHLQHQGFVQTMDLPSLFAIDQVKMRINYLNAKEYYAKKVQDLFTRHLDQTDVVLARVRGAEADLHLT
ncbi:hypothetical protein PENTCL1PPCAC_29666, partial [Pristionchus entomophagus]